MKKEKSISSSKKGIKTVTINYMLIFAVVAVLFGIAFDYSVNLMKAEQIVNLVEDKIISIANNSELTMEEKEKFEDIFTIIVDIFGNVGEFIVKLLFVWLPIIQGIYLFLFSTIARLVYVPEKDKVVTYRILMGLVCTGLLLMVIAMIFYIWFYPSFFKKIEMIFLEICLIVVFVVNIRNTYTNKIYKTT